MQTDSSDVETVPPIRHSATAMVLVGALCGLAWAAAFRAFMAEIAGGTSRFEWYGTFGSLAEAGAR
jgi:hypothetical protein